jgi:ribosomal protein S18 acetylase RimI-like enzyme
MREIAHKGMALTRKPPAWLRHQNQGRYQIREGVSFTAQELEGPGFNFASVVGEAPSPQRVFDMAAEFFAGKSGGYGILVEAEAGHPMEAELRSRGWQIAEDEPALVLPEIARLPAPPDGLELCLITELEPLRLFQGALAAGFEAPAETGSNWMSSLDVARDPDMGLLMGRVDGQPVATAVLACVDGIATIHGVATIPAFRRRGFGKAVTWAAVQEGARRGCTSAALRALGISYDMYRRMGFVEVCKHRTYAPPHPV